ncbi:MAG: hypothetical protein ABI579_05100, partial [Candidatus Sumerlaeota bacterium]
SLTSPLRRGAGESLQRQKKAMRELAIGGWKDEATEEVQGVIERNSVLVTAVTASAGIKAVSFPPTKDLGVDSPRPPFELLETVAYFLTANARMVEGVGQIDEAMARLCETAVLGERFCRPRDEACLNGHLAGLAMIDLSLNGMMKIMAKRAPGDAALQECYKRLTEIDNDLIPVTQALEADADVFAKEIISRADSPSRLSSGLQFYDKNLTAEAALQKARDAGADMPTFDVEQAKLWAEISRIMSQPFYARPVLDAAWLDKQTTNRLAKLYFPDVETLAVREAATHARLRLLRAACLEALGRTNEAQALADPFSGKPILVTEKFAYSVGPDGKDDRGAVFYEPAQGALSNGDIVAFFPPIVE